MHQSAAATSRKISPMHAEDSPAPRWFTMLIHEENFSPHELILNPELFPQLCVGDLVELVFREPLKSQLTSGTGRCDVDCA